MFSCSQCAYVRVLVVAECCSFHGSRESDVNMRTFWEPQVSESGDFVCHHHRRVTELCMYVRRENYIIYTFVHENDEKSRYL